MGEWGPEEMKLVSPGRVWRRCAMTGALPETSSPLPWRVRRKLRPSRPRRVRVRGLPHALRRLGIAYLPAGAPRH
jgi:hypothetical protein